MLRLILCSDAGKALVLRAIKNHKEETSTRTVSEISTKTDVKTMPSILMFLRETSTSTTLMPSTDPMDPTMDQEISTTLPSMDLTMDPTMDQEMISEISMDPKTMPSILVDHKEISTQPREVTLEISTLPLEDLNRDQTTPSETQTETLHLKEMDLKITSMDLNKTIVKNCKRRFSCSIVNLFLEDETDCNVISIMIKLAKGNQH